MDYKSRAKRYVEIFSREEKKLSSSHSTVTARMISYLEDDSVFLIWALDDVRTVDHTVWQHLAPRLFPDLKVRLDVIIAQFSANKERASAFAKLFADFAHERLIATYGESNEKDSWIKANRTRFTMEYLFAPFSLSMRLCSLRGLFFRSCIQGSYLMMRHSVV